MTQRQASDYELAQGSAPYVYDIDLDDSVPCQFAKVASNNAASSIFSAENDDGVFSSATPIRQHYEYHQAEKNVRKNCPIKLASFTPNDREKPKVSNVKRPLEEVLSELAKPSGEEMTKEQILFESREIISSSRKLVRNICPAKDIEVFEKGCEFADCMINCMINPGISSFIGLATGCFDIFKKKKPVENKTLKYILQAIEGLRQEMERNFEEIKEQLSIIEKLNIRVLFKLTHVETTTDLSHDLIVNIYNSLMHGAISDKLNAIFDKLNSISGQLDKIRYNQIITELLDSLLRVNIISPENYNMSTFNTAMEEIDLALVKCLISEGFVTEMNSKNLIEKCHLNELFTEIAPLSILSFITTSLILHVSMISPILDEESKISWSNMKTLENVKSLWNQIYSFSEHLKDQKYNQSIFDEFKETKNNLEIVTIEETKELHESMLRTKCENKRKILRDTLNASIETYLKEMPSFKIKDYFDAYNWFYVSIMNDCHGRRDKAKFHDNYGFTGADFKFTENTIKEIQEFKKKSVERLNTDLDKIFVLDAQLQLKGFFIPLIYPDLLTKGPILEMPLEFMTSPAGHQIALYQLYVNPHLSAVYYFSESKKDTMTIRIQDGHKALSLINVQLNSLGKISDELTLWYQWNGGNYSEGVSSRIDTQPPNNTGQGNTWYNWITFPTLSIKSHKRDKTTFCNYDFAGTENEEKDFQEKVSMEVKKSLKYEEVHKKFMEDCFMVNTFLTFSEIEKWNDIVKNFDVIFEFYKNRVSERPKNTLMETRELALGMYKMIKNPDISKEEMVELADQLIRNQQAITDS